MALTHLFCLLGELAGSGILISCPPPWRKPLYRFAPRENMPGPVLKITQQRGSLHGDLLQGDCDQCSWRLLLNRSNQRISKIYVKQIQLRQIVTEWTSNYGKLNVWIRARSVIPCKWVHVQLCLTLCDPMNCSLPVSSVYGISQARILEWVAISFSKGSSWSRERTSFLYWQVDSLSLNHLGSPSYPVRRTRRLWRLLDKR